MEAQIEKIELGDFEEIIRISDIVFPDTIGFNRKYIGSFLRNRRSRNISIKLVLNGEIIGFYILIPQEFEKVRRYFKEVDVEKGLEGVALGLLSEYRGTGLGKKLINYPYTLTQYDYIFGEHFKHLNNMKDWEKRRLILNPNADIFISLGRLKPGINESKGYIQKPNFEILQQTEGWNCGPTALFMAYKPMKNYKPSSIEEVSNLCGADNISGTTDARMLAGLTALNIKNARNTETNGYNALLWLRNTLEDGNVFLLRGLVKGIKHWVLVTEYDESTGLFTILDPWLGVYHKAAPGVNKIWEPRDYDGFVVFKENY